MNKKTLLILATFLLPACGVQGVSPSPINLSEAFKPIENSIPVETGQSLDTANQISGVIAQVNQILESQGLDINNMGSIYQAIDPAVLDAASRWAQSAQDAVMSVETRKEAEEK